MGPSSLFVIYFPLLSSLVSVALGGLFYHGVNLAISPHPDWIALKVCVNFPNNITCQKFISPQLESISPHPSDFTLPGPGGVTPR